MQRDFFASPFQNQDKRLNKLGDPLLELDELIDWDIFRPVLKQVHARDGRQSNAGRKPLDEMMMFRVLVLQQHYNLSDPQTEYQIEDRRSFRRFIGLHKDVRSPDHNTIRMFREKLTEKELLKPLFDTLSAHIESQGFTAKKGQIIDATLVPVPVQRNSREENADIKSGKPPQDWSEEKRRQKDTDARWTKKNGKSHFGYKNHINVDNEYKIIREYDVTDASVHDSQVFEDILDEDNSNKEVYADSAYRSEEAEAFLKEQGYRSKIHRKGKRNKPLTKREQQGNRTKSQVRVRVEHIFGSIVTSMGGKQVRTIGLSRAKTKIGLTNLVYNMKRFASISREVAS